MFTHIDLENLPPKITRETNVHGSRWYTTPDGNKYPSITTVLGHKEKPWLENWKVALGDKKAKQEMERTSARGSATHELIEKYLNNEKYPDFTRGYKSEYIAGFNQLKIRLNKIDNIRAQETALYSDTLETAGTVDCVGEYEGTLSIIDFKTSNNNKTSNMIEDYYLQCTAYAIMWHELTGEAVENIIVLMTVEKGMMPLVFKQSIDKYVKPLLIRIDDYYKSGKK